MGKNNKIGSVVRIRQMLKQWQRKAHIGSNNDPHASDVPPGHVAVSVGENRRRYVVRAKHLNHPIFRRLLAEAEEEYGFSNVGPLAIPCDESLFEEIIEVVTRSDSSGRGNPVTLEDIRRCNHVGMAKSVEYLSESGPLLPGIAEKSVC
jgi:SAUR family protein